MAHSSLQQPQQAIPQVQPGLPQANQPVATSYRFSAGNGPSPMPAQNQSALNQQIPIQPTPVGRPNTIPPRTGATPHQISGGQLPNPVPPDLGNFAVQSEQETLDQALQLAAWIVPLDKQRSQTMYTHFCRGQNMDPCTRVLTGNRMVDLYQLHAHVMCEGGAASVTQRDMWAVIGGRLDFIEFPGNASEPARSGPVITQQLQNIYDQYLQHFESAYILSVKNRTVLLLERQRFDATYTQFCQSQDINPGAQPWKGHGDTIIDGSGFFSA